MLSPRSALLCLLPAPCCSPCQRILLTVKGGDEGFLLAGSFSKARMLSLGLRGKHEHRSQLLKIFPTPVFPHEPQCLGSVLPAGGQHCGGRGATDLRLAPRRLTGTSTCGEPQVSPVPPVQCKEPQASKVSQEQHGVESPIQENLFWEEAPVHCPFELELAAQVEGASQVPHRVH